MSTLLDFLFIGAFIVFIASIIASIRAIINYRKRRAVAWLDVARALTSTDPRYISAVVRTHSKTLDKYIKKSLLDRKRDLEVEEEVSSSVKTYQEPKPKHKVN